MTDVQTVDDVVARLEAIDASLPATDGVSCFNRVYLAVTRLVRDRIATDYFADPDAMHDLDVTFARLYLAAIDADARGRRVPRAWEPLFARRADDQVVSIQFAMSGINAHINHDLAVAVVATCDGLRCEPDTGSFYDDYLKVNSLLEQVVGELRQSFIDEDLRRAGRDLTPVLDLVSTWSIEKARAAAWVNAQVLWRLRDVPFIGKSFRETLAGSVGLATATLLTPLLDGASTPQG